MDIIKVGLYAISVYLTVETVMEVAVVMLVILVIHILEDLVYLAEDY